MRLSSDTLMNMYEIMYRIRIFEEKSIKFSMTGVFPGKLHSSLGMEATAVGACFAIKGNGYVLSTHRPVGHLLAMGCDAGKIFAEFMGKRTGFSHGRGGMMHIADLRRGFLGTDGIVGSGIPIATGAAYALKLRKGKKVVICFFGDGASNTGAFHEGINLAAVLRVPLVFICENNQYAVSTHASKSTLLNNIGKRAESYGIPGVTVDGNDPVSVFEAVDKFAKMAMAGGGPSLIECETYRLRGHYEGDPLNYRPKEEYRGMLEREPVGRFKKTLLREEVCSEEAIAAMEEKVEKEIEAAAQFGMESGASDVTLISENVYKQ